jgi:hypothetical protein
MRQLHGHQPGSPCRGLDQDRLALAHLPLWKASIMVSATAGKRARLLVTDTSPGLANTSPASHGDHAWRDRRNALSGKGEHFLVPCAQRVTRGRPQPRRR